ncbi:MAG: DUF3311 domain-containing protein [Halodesulfurarchaeum sp.]
MQRVGPSLAWVGIFLVLAALAVPWFLWGDETVVAGLPVWLWWHIGWMILTAVTFRRFATRHWGLWTGVDA